MPPLSIGLLWFTAYLGVTKQWILAEAYAARDITQEYVATKEALKSIEKYMLIVQGKRKK